ncbi:MAG: AAA family ATPase [Bacteroidales bacterium]|nr:AAA family ATPase [Bacteroidales bacterium]
MIDKRIIEKVLTEQLEEIEELKKASLCPREEELQVDFESGLAQVVIGVRRSGKSILCHNVLMKLGEKFAYADFDDERFKDMTSDDLDNVLEVLYKINGDFNVLLLS